MRIEWIVLMQNISLMAMVRTTDTTRMASAPQLLLGGVCDSHSGSPSDLSGCETGSSAERKQPTGKPVP